MQIYLNNVPARNNQAQTEDTSEDEVVGWASLFSSQNYDIAADRFERCWESARNGNLLEIGAFYGWQWAKALYLQSLLGEPTARERALTVFDDAIKRGGQSSWFNRMRASLNRARQITIPEQAAFRDDYSNHLIRVFDDILEKQGAHGDRFNRYCDSITNALQSNSHSQFQEGLEKLGVVIGYHATRPRYGAATDCRWRGVFGNSKEVITFEAKIEHNASTDITAHDVGQAHNQLARALAEYEPHSYIVRGTITTHLTKLATDAQASAGPIKIITKPAILALWNRVRLILSMYRDKWSLHDIQARMTAAQLIRPKY